MKFMTAEQIRNTWLSFFESKKHKIESSASLVPQNDPTLLWINAGVAPLKKYFDGTEIPSNPRLTNVQKCIRTNDIDNVGKTARHHTFFEMLGNFSIGDYFKDEAIEWGLEILTDPKWFGFPIEKLYMTYYPDDFYARDKWISLGVDPAHLIPRADNFWEIGPGPCGPDTEIYFDRGESFDKRGVELIIDDVENERYIEIWNIVFSQYNAKPNLNRDQYPELPNKNIDTGAGLERFACVIQQTETNFETDLFLPTIKKLEQMTQVKYKGQMAYKVIADHIKALTFAISDGALLSNEGRGYVLRRLLRRAVKYGRKLGLVEPFLHVLVDEVVKTMGVFYQNLYETKDIVKKIVLKEEQKFLETINEGEKHLHEAILKEGHKLSGETAFRLYDTYGFPIELTIEIASELQVSVDIDAFYQHLNEQKERSRNARNQLGSMKAQEEAFINFTEPSKFIGYSQLVSESKVIKIFDEGIVLDQTPFYATSGGQVADAGTINGLDVYDVIKLPNGQFLHKVENGFSEGDDVLAIVDQKQREKTIKNHSATHLLHQALKEIFGKHCNQQGSQVSPKNLRFDFNHFETESEDQILKIEQRVKYFILDAPLKVEIKEMPIEDAKKLGAMALFGEKYGDVVRVIDMDYSKELCGGTHVENTNEIKDFAIYSYESIGSGIYRIEATSGDDIKNQIKSYLANSYQEIDTLRDKMKRINPIALIPVVPALLGSYQDIINIRSYIQEMKELIKAQEKELNKEKNQNVLKRLDDFITDNESKRQLIYLEGIDSKVLKQLMDALYDKIKAETLFIVNVEQEKATFLCKSSVDQANDLIKKAASLTNGSGGGKPSLAQGGTQDLTHLAYMIETIKGIL
jgi:alanyl-tRNA synthetase